MALLMRQIKEPIKLLKGMKLSNPPMIWIFLEVIFCI